MKRLSDKITDLLNFRIKAEFESAYLYEAMANCLDFKGFANAAKVYRRDAKDERKHAQWTVSYMLGMDVHPIIPTIEAPKKQMWDSVKQIADETVIHEDMVTKQCNELAKAALLDNDLVTHQFVSSKYLAEQIEECAKVLERQKYAELYKDDPAALEVYFKEVLE